MTLLVTDPLYLQHRTPGHVECPERLQAIQEHFRNCGLTERLTALPARDATVDELALMHGREYIEVVREISQRGGGWFDSDTYLNEHSYAAAIRAAGGVLAAVEAVRDGRDRTALCLVRPPGHHALPERGMGFCLFNNVAIAARFLKRRVLIVDWDVHHGNGTQEMVEDDPSITYVSTHRFPFYPGTGWAEERGVGNIINVPMEGRTSRQAFMERFTSAVRKAAAESKPEFLLVSCGFDAYEDDPIGGLNLKPEDYRLMTDVVCGLGVPVVSALEGGYSLEGLGPCAEQHALGLLGEGEMKEIRR
ncbi:MAG: histone deacetylase [Planctomycetaceae bacterium]|nr:histone deacetylase [Planctomycetaceae bacterium]